MVKFAKQAVKGLLTQLATPLTGKIRDVAMQSEGATQQLLIQNYRNLVQMNQRLPGVGETGFKCHSQTDEDGILLFLFAVMGVTNKLCVEVCVEDGSECNTANLILNHAWHALLVDGDRENVERGKQFFAKSRYTYVYPPKFAHAWITRDSINETIANNGFSGEVDLFSLDLDGVDYWIWEALTVISPRVVVVEYCDIVGPERACTVPYSDAFSCRSYPMTQGMPNFAGASLAAFVKLGKRKGYRLVGVNRYGFNAFFVRNDVAAALIPEVDAASCFTHPKVVGGMRERFPTVKDLPWIDV